MDRLPDRLWITTIRFTRSRKGLMRLRTIMLGFALIGLCAGCSPSDPPTVGPTTPLPVSPSSPAPLTDFHTPDEAEAAVTRILDTAGEDEFISVRVQPIGVTVEVVDPNDESQLSSYTIQASDPEKVEGPEPAGDAQWFNAPLAPDEVAWQPVLDVADGCDGPITMVNNLGFDTGIVTTSCMGEEAITSWLSDLTPVSLTIEPSTLSDSLARLVAGFPNAIRRVTVAAGEEPQLSVSLADGAAERTLQMVSSGVGASGNEEAVPTPTFGVDMFDAEGLLECAATQEAELGDEWVVRVRSENDSLVYDWTAEGEFSSFTTSSDCEPLPS